MSREHRLGRSIVAVAGLALLCAACAKPVAVETSSDVMRARTARDVGADHLAKGRLALAIRQLTLSESLNPKDPSTQLWLGEGFRRKGRLEDAEKHVRRAIELAPNHYDSRLTLSALLVQMERYDDAVAEADRLFQDPMFSQPWKALSNRGWAQFKKGDRDAARKSLLEALDFRPTYWRAILNLGILEREAGHHLRAIQYFQQVVDMGLGYAPEAEANYRIGEVYVNLGNRDKAITHFVASLENAPYGNWAKQSQSYLNLLQ